MPRGEYLGELELLVLCAVQRLGDDAYGTTIRDEIESRAGRDTSIGTVYATLSRLHEKGFVAFSVSDPLPVRGGKARRHVRLTAAGTRTLRASTEGLARMLGLSLRPTT